MPKLRVGIVNYLNSKPLAWGFLKGHHSNLFEASYHPPALVAQLLQRGGLDIGLIPAIEVQRISGLRVLPDLCVAATQEVRSVLLVHEKPIEEVHRVAVDHNSRTSAALVKIILSERFGLTPTYARLRPDPQQMLVEADAALIIGDPALRVDRERYKVIDLAAEWRGLTGLPAVFAVWAVAPNVSLRDLPFYFKSSLRFGLSSLETMVRECAAEMGLATQDVHSYLTENLSYFLADDQLKSLEEFYRRASRLDLIAEPQPIELWSG